MRGEHLDAFDGCGYKKNQVFSNFSYKMLVYGHLTLLYSMKNGKMSVLNTLMEFCKRIKAWYGVGHILVISALGKLKPGPPREQVFLITESSL